FQAEDGIRDRNVTGVQTCALPIYIQMPYLDGRDTVKQWRQQETGDPLPIIALTAHALDEEKQLLLQSGFTDYLAKPASQEDLLRSEERRVGKEGKIQYRAEYDNKT